KAFGGLFRCVAACGQEQPCMIGAHERVSCKMKDRGTGKLALHSLRRGFRPLEHFGIRKEGRYESPFPSRVRERGKLFGHRAGKGRLDDREDTTRRGEVRFESGPARVSDSGRV